ncbi:uncharacterized protein LOC132269178 [Cornus florida]|uniref:uncharacterized protein LOC132269178 n=1 Tax=Cornus florida TaxID=4283 RepID=UPI00289659F4|nr:uncharacterized protein LOC132269178 [Cornus florida]
MDCFPRTKRVTSDLLGDKVRARIFGLDRSSSGSEHARESDDESLSLSDLVDGFLVDDDASVQLSENELDSGSDRSISTAANVIQDLIRKAVTDRADSFKNELVARVYSAMVAFSSVTPDKLILRRRVMAFLRDCGYNAAICKTKWESSGGLTSGNYEFIDVVRSDLNGRYFIELDLAGEFEIARPTNQYEQMFQALPRVLVGRSEELKQIVKVMSDAAKLSLKSRGLHLPPWRKNRYMQNKWFGPYRRTMNFIPANSSSFPLPPKPTLAVKCRSVGFDAVNGRLLSPAITRTR